VVGENGTNSKVKGLINDIFPDVKLHLNRNAERDLPRMSNRNGFFNVTSLSNDEIHGNFLGLVVLMHTTYGEALLRPCFEKYAINYEDMLETCCLVLSWERFHIDPQKRVDLEYSSTVTQDLMQRIFCHIPRPEKEKTGKNAPGSHGWRIPKMHAFSFFGYLNRKFGSAKCFDSGCKEKNHKFFVKANAKLMQRISSKFATQLANNDYDRVVTKRVFDYICILYVHRIIAQKEPLWSRAMNMRWLSVTMTVMRMNWRRNMTMRMRRRRNCTKRMLRHPTLNRIWPPVMY
jgi:hypothetical protein